MAADCNVPAVLSDISTKDSPRLVGRIAESLAGNSAFMNVLDGGTLEAGVSDVVRSSVQMPAAPGDSLAIPTFVADVNICGTVGEQDLTDTVEFTYQLESKRGFGPRVCMKKGYAAYKDSYIMAEDALSKLVTQYINADIRAQLYLRSASKFNATAGYCFEDLFTGGEHTDVGVKFAPVIPTGPLSFKALQVVLRYVKEALYPTLFEGDGKGQPHAKFIGSSQQIDAFRNEIGVERIMSALAAGSYKIGENTLTAYSWETSPAFRGLAFGTDQSPLRATGFNQDGTLALVNPRLTIANVQKNTAYSVHNPAWLRAPLEVGFLIFKNSFKRLVPSRYVGEGSFRFSPQLVMGELKWHYVEDNDCNVWGDYGWHKYQITRAYQPVRPHHIVPILYRRCDEDLGLETCLTSTCAPLISVL
jgi:hypothetical protein